MNILDLYQELRLREALPLSEVKKKKRIAALYQDEIDIMKVLDAGIVKPPVLSQDTLVVSAHICPRHDDKNKLGLGSFRVTKDGVVYLNDLIEIAPEDNILRYELPGTIPSEAPEIYGPLKHFDLRGYYIEAERQPIVTISREEMHLFQRFL